MTAPPRILLVNPNTSVPVTDRLAAEARRVACTRAEILSATARFGAAGIETLAEATVAAHAVLDAVAATADMDAVIVAAFMDPGLEALRESAAVPAVGIAESGVRAASAGGRRFAIVSLAPRLRVGVERVVADCGAADRLAAIRYVSGGVLDLARDRAAFLDEIGTLARRVVAEDGADAVLFGGAVFAGIGGELGDRVGVPLFDGVGDAVEAALAAVAANPIRPQPCCPTKPYPGLPEGLARLLAGGLAGPA